MITRNDDVTTLVTKFLKFGWTFRTNGNIDQITFISFYRSGKEMTTTTTSWDISKLQSAQAGK